MNLPTRVDDQRHEVVERLVKDLQEHKFQWAAAWSRCWAPRNATTGEAYRGGNRMGLAAVGVIRGYDDPRWCTFAQARAQGWRVKKGAKSAVVEKWKMLPDRPIEGKEAAEVLEDGERQKLHPVCVGSWSVFNARDIEGIPELEVPARMDDEAGRVADEFIESSRCPVRETASDEAFYSLGRDEVVVPMRGQFVDNKGFLNVLLHEMTHSTDPELGRDMGGLFGTPQYAREELVAELGSMFTAADAGLDCGAIAAADRGSRYYEQHAAYLQSWIQALQKDPAELYVAAARASKASDYLCGRRQDLLTGGGGGALQRDLAPERVPSLAEEARAAQGAARAQDGATQLHQDLSIVRTDV